MFPKIFPSFSVVLQNACELKNHTIQIMLFVSDHAQVCISLSVQ